MMTSRQYCEMELMLSSPSVILLEEDAESSVHIVAGSRLLLQCPLVSSKDCFSSLGSSRTSRKVDFVSLCAARCNNASVAAPSVKEGLPYEPSEEDWPRYRKVDVFRLGDGMQ